MRKLLLALAFVLCAPLAALATEQTVLTRSPEASNVNLSGTITATNTFQSVQAQNSNRLGCTIQNLSASDKMWVYFGPVASALTPTSLQLAAGASVNCAQVPGALITDQVSVTGTAGDLFYAGFQ